MTKPIPAALVLLLVGCSSYAPSPSPSVQPKVLGRSLNPGLTVLGGKRYVEEEWDPTRDFSGFGLEFDAVHRAPDGAGAGFEFGYRRGTSKGESFALSHGGGGNVWKEVFAGARYERPSGFGRWLVSGGLSKMDVTATQNTIFGGSSPELSSVGWYARAGLIIPLTNHLECSIAARYRGGEDADETNRPVSLNQSSLDLGISWRF